MIDEAFAGAPSLTLQQFEAQALARFDAADLNHDGVVTAAERQQVARPAVGASYSSDSDGASVNASLSVHEHP